VKIGIGLPNTVLHATGEEMLAWATRADERGFSTLATIDRIVYPSYDSLVSLAAAAGATSRIGLLTNVLLGPLYEPYLLAKQSASLDQLSGGRFTLGLGVGSRGDDYSAMHKELSDRGKRFDDELELLHRAWAGKPVEPSIDGEPHAAGPLPTNGTIPLLIGGQPRHVAPRAVKYGAGWTIGGGGVDMARAGVETFRTAWTEAGGLGEPRIVALTYFSLGEDNVDESTANLASYYAYLTEWVDGIVNSAPRTQEAVTETVKAFEDIGIDELIFDATVRDPGQVDLLADAVL
jgi:alkanesulfonate monooxygenase SsuD/methylene tetrahydromethanopterin reductase-like flavin-dependent oxidoreductase (luciferase family)